ncbi:RNA ligase family protein [Deinococcus cellulosilyticus]|nr:RNA ligase family protein [Deinococcus cellulosilyticus]
MKRIYGRIPHLPGSRTGPADRTLDPCMALRLTSVARPGDLVHVQEKLDGTCVAVLRLEGDLLAYGWEGRLCSLSLNDNRRAFAVWLEQNQRRFSWLKEGERAVFEWLPVAHGTRYHLPHEPLVVLDVFEASGHRMPLLEMKSRVHNAGFCSPALLHSGEALSISSALQNLGPHGHHGAIDSAEGVIYRLERGREVLQLAKFVRQGKQDGCFLSDHTGEPPVFNLYPKEVHA